MAELSPSPLPEPILHAPFSADPAPTEYVARRFPFRDFPMRVALALSALALASVCSASPAFATVILPSPDMCDVDPRAYTGELNDNGFVEKLHYRLTAGTVTCDRHTMARLGTAADGRGTVVYRFSQVDSIAVVDARLVEQGGNTVLAITTPAENFLLRGTTGFTALDVQWNIDDAQLRAALPPGDVLPYAPDHEVDGDFVTFNLDAFSLDVPLAVAVEVSPRDYADPGLDRPLWLRFPLVLRGGILVPGDGRVALPSA